MSSLNVDFAKLKSLLDEHLKPIWEKNVENTYKFRYGGGEIYLQNIIEKASPLLWHKILRKTQSKAY